LFQTFKWFALCLTGLLLSIALVVWSRNDAVESVAALLGIFVLLPLCIVTYKDAVGHFASLAPHRTGSTMFLAVPIRVLGAACFLVGIAIFAWLGYNLLIARQRQFTGISSSWQLLPPLGLVLLGWKWLRTPLAKSRKDEAA